MRTSLIALIAIAAGAVGAVGVLPGHEEIASVSKNSQVSGQDGSEGEVVGEQVQAGKSERLPAPRTMPVQLLAEAGAPSQSEPSRASSPLAPVAGEQSAAPANPTEGGGSGDTSRPSVDASRPSVDESALRYFAARGDTVRLQAEISRLRMLYPGWQPPENPMAITTGVDSFVQSLWQTYADGRYDEVRKAISGRQQSEPGWMPPEELQGSLRLAEARQSLVKASDDKRYDSVISLASGAPELLTCTEVDVLWRVAEAFARTSKPERARDVYAYVLKTCRTPQLRLASMQKASTLLQPTLLEDLLKLEQPSADGHPEFDGIRDDIARQIVARAGQDGGISVQGVELERLEKAAEREGKASDALLLGWYHYRRNDMATAKEWFERSYAKEPNASAAQGLALTQVALGTPGEAEKTMFRFYGTDQQARAVYLSAVAALLSQDPPKVIDNSVLSRMAPIVIAARNAAAAEQFGWYARALQQMSTAADWFRLVLSWDATYEPAAYGLALSLDTLGDKTGVAQIKAKWAGQSDRIAAVGETRPSKDRLAVKQVARSADRSAVAEMGSSTSGAVSQTRSRPTTMVALQQDTGAARTRRAGCSSTLPAGQLSPPEALMRGWCLMDLKRPMEAVEAFDRAFSGGDLPLRQDAAYGKSLALLRLKLTDKAAAAAASVPLGKERARELQLAILADRAVGAFQLGRAREALIALDQRARLMPEPQDLLLLRGYAYQKLGYVGEARQIFQTLSDVGNTSALKALADIRANDPGEPHG
ncbi:tetratricopeptide repeat protein [Agrobacterium vitis]|uniref:tetratricopeptide repeat protein n=1 Tax=Agrobacterium vitis TaxID=373 RepID=UPI0009C19E37|nr:tetratricopeptide repeat protein [Agrobacterium vitis]MCE6075730.1 cellulose synthase [Agrobacterium vitis]MCM2468209.1 tetratricopeptide repeat protein [Agrobacterium vitis]MUO70328.1 cellulose synthase [Agrobacterium vitis]MUO82481.1 cellulose synthase [Agrobacterium vitis]